MTPRTITLAALVAALAAAGGVAYSVGDAVDVEYSYRDVDTGKMAHGTARCLVTSADPLDIDCGDLPEDARIHGDTSSAKYATIGSPGKVAKRERPCACGPVAHPNSCRVTTDGNRAAAIGEFIPAGAWDGDCVIRPCFELGEVIDGDGAGYSMPSACVP